ncbi:MAG: hypothetical protein EBX52_03200 [Proteobacteria bacterium]|nr:hypothetical protein [Pseudomonadota bacterium]
MIRVIGKFQGIIPSWLLALTLALAGVSVSFSSPAQAQDFPDDVPFIDDFQIPQAQPGDLQLPDEDLPVSDAQARAFGNAMLENQERVYRDVVQLEVLLKEKIERVIPELGRKRISEIKAALMLPEGSGERRYKLGKLNAKAFMKLPNWDSAEGEYAIGEALFLDRVSAGGNLIDDFRVVVPGTGFAEPKLVGGKLYPRMVDEYTGSSHFFLESELDINSADWQRYIARVRAWSNRGKGRPQVFWTMHEPVVDASGVESRTIRVKFFDRPKGRWNKLTNWWKAVYVRPDKQAFVQAGIKTVLEVGAAEMLTYLLAKGHVDHTFTALTIGYATVLGIFGSTFRNALSPVDPTNFWERTYKMGLRLLITSYSFGMWNKVLRNGAASVSWFSPTGRAMNLEILKNSIASNVLRDGFNSLNDVREATGHARYTVDVAGVKLKGTQLERTLWYQIPNTLKNADLLTLKSEMNALPHFLFYSAIVATPIAVWKHAQALRYEHAEDLPAASVFRFMKNVREGAEHLWMDPKTYAPLIASMIKDYGKSLVRNCSNLLTRKNAEELHAIEPPFEATPDGEWINIQFKDPPATPKQ